IKFSNIKGANIIAFATDGMDGSSPQSCYYINDNTYGALLDIYELDLDSQQYNMGELFQKINYSFKTKSTNINYADIILLIKK
ncbi:MAG: hypothetical protein GPJ54_13145, partial [Candidatus Heimdallarchaeota archaeon]|nr:hypothetical protein [Candidatus Heimdallarchaeota archaeon]